MGRLPRHNNFDSTFSTSSKRTASQRRPFDTRTYAQFLRDRHNRNYSFAARRPNRPAPQFSSQRNYPARGTSYPPRETIYHLRGTSYPPLETGYPPRATSLRPTDPRETGRRTVTYADEAPPVRAEIPIPFWQSAQSEDGVRSGWPDRPHAGDNQDATGQTTALSTVIAPPAAEVYPANDAPFVEPEVIHSQLAGPQEQAIILNEAGRPDDIYSHNAPLIPNGVYGPQMPQVRLQGVGAQKRTQDGVPPTNPQHVVVAPTVAPPVTTVVPAPPPVPTPAQEFLYANDRVDQSRFLYSINRFPALVMVVVGMWIQFSRGRPKRETTEEMLAIFAVTTGLCTLVGQLYGIHNHRSLFTALIQTYFRLGHLVMKVLLGVAVFVTSAMALRDIRNESSPQSCDDFSCYSHNERLTFASVLLGVSIMLLLVSTLTFIMGFFALRSLLRDQKYIYNIY